MPVFCTKMRCGEWWASSPVLRGSRHPCPLLPITHLVDYLSPRCTWYCRKTTEECDLFTVVSWWKALHQMLFFFLCVVLSHPDIFDPWCSRPSAWVSLRIVPACCAVLYPGQNAPEYRMPVLPPAVLLGCCCFRSWCSQMLHLVAWLMLYGDATRLVGPSFLRFGPCLSRIFRLCLLELVAARWPVMSVGVVCHLVLWLISLVCYTLLLWIRGLFPALRRAPPTVPSVLRWCRYLSSAPWDLHSQGCYYRADTKYLGLHEEIQEILQIQYRHIWTHHFLTETTGMNRIRPDINKQGLTNGTTDNIYQITITSHLLQFLLQDLTWALH